MFTHANPQRTHTVVLRRMGESARWQQGDNDDEGGKKKKTTTKQQKKQQQQQMLQQEQRDAVEMSMHTVASSHSEGAWIRGMCVCFTSHSVCVSLSFHSRLARSFIWNPHSS